MISLSRAKIPALLAFLAVSMVGCATQVVEKPSAVTRATTNLGEFDRVVLVKGEIAPTYAEHGANIKAVNKIDEILAQQLPGVLDNVEVRTLDEYKSMKSSLGADALVIRPYVKQVKFIGGAARFWAGAMAGSSVVVMDVFFEKGTGGEPLSTPGFQRTAGAYTDMVGVASNRMLSDVAQDVVNYVIANK